MDNNQCQLLTFLSLALPKNNLPLFQQLITLFSSGLPSKYKFILYGDIFTASILRCILYSVGLPSHSYLESFSYQAVVSSNDPLIVCQFVPKLALLQSPKNKSLIFIFCKDPSTIHSKRVTWNKDDALACSLPLLNDDVSYCNIMSHKDVGKPYPPLVVDPSVKSSKSPKILWKLYKSECHARCGKAMNFNKFKKIIRS